MNEFSRRLREARKARSLTQEELAEKADISRVMVSRYETEMVIPTVEVLISLADALDISIDYLLGRTSNKKQFYQSFPSAEETSVNRSKDFPENRIALREFVLEVLREQNLLE